MEAAQGITISQIIYALHSRIGCSQEICFVLFSGLCTIVDATTTAWSVSSNLAYEINPFVAWLLTNPALFIVFEAGWFLITVAAFQVLNHLHRKYNVRKIFRLNNYIIIIAACSLRLLAGLHNVNVIMSTFIRAA